MEARQPGSVTRLYQKAAGGDQAAVRDLLQRLMRDFQTKLHANLSLLQATDRDVVANDMLHRFYTGLIRGDYNKVRDRSDLWNLLAAINRNCRLENWKRSQTKRAQAIKATSLPEDHQLSGDTEPPDELASFADSFRHASASVERHIRATPGDAFMLKMLPMLVEGYDQREIIQQLGITRHKYRTRLDILLRLCTGDTNDGR
ncbi:MAG: ECF-type sigma factor [Planctomycetota bacterium]